MVLQYVCIVRERAKTLLLVVIEIPCQGFAEQILTFVNNRHRVKLV
jgi:hypothetical protein